MAAGAICPVEKLHEQEIKEKQSTAFETQILIGLPEKRADSHHLRLTRLTPAQPRDSAVKDQLVLGSATWILWDRLSYPDMAVLRCL